MESSFFARRGPRGGPGCNGGDPSATISRSDAKPELVSMWNCRCRTAVLSNFGQDAELGTDDKDANDDGYGRRTKQGQCELAGCSGTSRSSCRWLWLLQRGVGEMITPLGSSLGATCSTPRKSTTTTHDEGCRQLYAAMRTDTKVVPMTEPDMAFASACCARSRNLLLRTRVEYGSTRAQRTG